MAEHVELKLTVQGPDAATDEDPDRPVTYPLRWPTSMASDAAKAAKARTTSLAAWLREAVREKLERDGGQS